MRSSVLLVFIVVISSCTHFTSAACDEPEKHAPRNRAHGKRNHGDLPIPIHVTNPAQTVNIFPGGHKGNIQFIPDSFQIPVSIVHEEPAASTRPISVPGANVEENKLCSDVAQRYDNETGKCFYPGVADSPCDKLMDFVADSDNSIYGHCECKSSDGCDYRPIGFWPATQRCYHLYEQGPCTADEWFVQTNGGTETCVPRSCPANPTDPTDSMKTWITVNETCYQLGTQAYCGNENEGLYFSMDPEGKVVLVCSVRPIIRPCVKAITASATIDCDPGQKKTGSGGCSSVVGI